MAGTMEFMLLREKLLGLSRGSRSRRAEGARKGLGTAGAFETHASQPSSVQGDGAGDRPMKKPVQEHLLSGKCQ